MIFPGKPIARLVVRGADEADGLVLGVVMRGGVKHFQSGMVYELQENPLDPSALQIVPVGVAVPARLQDGEGVKDSPVGVSWGSGVEQVLSEAGKYLFLSRKEFAAIAKKEGQ